MNTSSIAWRLLLAPVLAPIIRAGVLAKLDATLTALWSVIPSAATVIVPLEIVSVTSFHPAVSCASTASERERLATVVGVASADDR
jgi:hypothetical protein